MISTCTIHQQLKQSQHKPIAATLSGVVRYIVANPLKTIATALTLQARMVQSQFSAFDVSCPPNTVSMGSICMAITTFSEAKYADQCQFIKNVEHAYQARYIFLVKTTPLLITT